MEKFAVYEASILDDGSLKYERLLGKFDSEYAASAFSVTYRGAECLTTIRYEDEADLPQAD